MNSVQSSVRSLMLMFDGKTKEFISDIENIDMVWLKEIQQEANRMFSRDFNAEPELMPKTPSQKKNSRRKRVSLGRQEDNPTKRRFSKGKRSNLRRSSVKSLNFITEEQAIPEASTSETTQPKRTTRKNKQAQSEVAEDVGQVSPVSCKTGETENKKPELVEDVETDDINTSYTVGVEQEDICSTVPSPPEIPLPELAVGISVADRLSAEKAKGQEPSPGRAAAKITIAGAARSSRRSSVRCSLKLRHSLAGLRHSMTQESVRRASRRSMLKKAAAHLENSTCSSNVDEESSMDEVDREAVIEASTADSENSEETSASPEIQIEQRVQPSFGRVTRSVAANSPTLAPPPLYTAELTVSTPTRKAEKQLLSKLGRRSRLSTKRKAPDTVEESPTKRFSPPKKSQSAIKPNMRSFLQTVHKNQMLMMTPNSLGRSNVIKSFIKHTTPIKTDFKTKERHKLEALKKKQEQEEERMKKMEEEKKRKQDELKRKRDERLRRVFEAKVKEEQREEEKKKKIEQKMANIDEKNDKRHAEEKAKKKVAVKRQEEVEQQQQQKKKLEEEARKKKLQQAEEEKRQQELLAKKKAEEEQQARKLAEARRALELKREQERERERELERERQAAAERERVEKEKALALHRELERAAREKERRELEEKRKALEEKRKLEEQLRKVAEENAAREAARQREAAAKQAAESKTAMNVTVDIERSVMSTPVGKGCGLNVTVDIVNSPQSYAITPKGGNKPLSMSKSTEDYGMDQNSDDSTDDESAPRKPIPSWAEGQNLQKTIMKQYFNPLNLDSFFGAIEPPKLENIFYKSKPRYYKRTSSAVWHSPPIGTK
ncbi:inner centromere protein isoform X2 [Labrus bergylta]|uniref:inner centromere protein isoform X2 n=1 Tax=Labrus bergylta TaxID=56723 RepID=UPI00331313AF